MMSSTRRVSCWIRSCSVYACFGDLLYFKMDFLNLLNFTEPPQKQCWLHSSFALKKISTECYILKIPLSGLILWLPCQCAHEKRARGQISHPWLCNLLQSELTCLPLCNPRKCFSKQLLYNNKTLHISILKSNSLKWLHCTILSKSTGILSKESRIVRKKAVTCQLSKRQKDRWKNWK